MSLKRNFVINTGFNLASYGYLLLASFFSISLLLANLGREVFGVYLFLASFVSLAAVFDFGVSTAVVRELSLPSTKQEDKDKIWQSSFYIFLFLAVILFFIVFGLLTYLTQSLPMFSVVDKNILGISSLLISITVFINQLNTHFLSLPQAEQRFDIFNSKTILVGTANTILSAILSFYYPNISLIFLLQLIFHILTLIFMSSYAIKHFPGKSFFPKLHTGTAKELISFGLKNFIGTFVSQVDTQFSKYALGSMISASAITAFSIPQNIVLKAAGVVSQISQVVFPFSTSLLERDRIQKLKKLILGIEALTFLGGLLAVFLSFTIGNEFLMWWLKDSVVVEMAFPVLKVMSIYFLLTALTPIPGVVFQSIGKPQISSLFAVLTVIADIIGMLILIPQHHALGAAYATLISSIITVPAFLLVFWIEFNSVIKKTQSLS